MRCVVLLVLAGWPFGGAPFHFPSLSLSLSKSFAFYLALNIVKYARRGRLIIFCAFRLTRRALGGGRGVADWRLSASLASGLCSCCRSVRFGGLQRVGVGVL